MVQTSPYPDVPVATVPLHELLLEAIEEHGRKHPNKPAMVWAENDKKVMTYSNILEKSALVSSYLTSIGFGHQDMLGTVLPNCFEFIYIYIGVLRCGGAISGAPSLFTNYELERQFLDAKCKIIATDSKNLEKVQKAGKNCPLIKQIICIDGSSSQFSTDVIAFSDVLKTPLTPVKPYNGSMDDVAAVPYSSGTTGSPKGVMITHKNFATMMTILVDHFTRQAAPLLRPNGDWSWYDQSMIIFLPLYHDFGFSLMHMCLLSGMTAILSDAFKSQLFLSSIQKYKVEIIFTVPPIVLFLTKYADLNKYDLSSIRVVISAGAALGKELCEEFNQVHKNALICQAYGLTECSLASHLPSFKPEDGNETVGFPIATYQMKIIDPRTCEEVPDGTRGEICLRGPTVMRGYLNRPEATAEMIDKDGWMRTGDIGYIDERGHTRIVDRIKELIKVNGRQVSPSELEDFLIGQADILDAAVIGIPHPRQGEVPRAFIVSNNATLKSYDIEKLIEEHFAVYKWLKGGVEFVSAIPKSPSGKILRRFLKEEAVAKL